MKLNSLHHSDFEETLEKNLQAQKISPKVSENFFDLQRFAEGDKTEDPTAKRRDDARKKGQVAKSQELNTAFVLLAGFLILRVFWEYMYKNVAAYSAHIFGHLHENGTTVEDVMKIFLDIVDLLVGTAFPVMIGVLIFALAVNVYQVGFMFSTERLEPKLDNLNPINGFGRLFSKRAIVELIKSLFKIIVIGFFLYLYLKDEIPFNLSGGEKRKVAFAGVFAMEPDIFIFDEPDAGLDSVSKRHFYEMLKDLNKNHNKTIICITHNLDDVIEYANKVIVLNDGKIERIGSPFSILSDKELLKKCNLIAPYSIDIYRHLHEKGIEIDTSRLKYKDILDELDKVLL